MMLRTAIWFVLMVFLAVQQTPAWAVRMPRGAFLTEPAHSAWHLSQLIKTNTLVAARYQKHYSVTGAAFATYAQTQLALRPLKRDSSYRVYFIRKDGSIGSSVRRLRKGTPVFLHLKSGQAVLLAECGNPLGATLPGYNVRHTKDEQLHNVGEAPATTSSAVSEPQDMLPPPLSTSETYPLDDPLMPDTQVADMTWWEADPALFMPEIPISQPDSLVLAGAPSLTPALGAVIIGSLGGGFSGGRGGGIPPAVPEPGSFVLWLSAGAALVGLGNRYRRRYTL